MNWKLSLTRADRKVLLIAVGLYIAAAIPLLLFPNGAPLLLGGATVLFVIIVVMKQPELRKSLRRHLASTTETAGVFLSGALLVAFYIAAFLAIIYMLVKFVRWAWYS